MTTNLNKKGLTLIELVVYMGILSLLLVVFIDMFALLVNKQLETESLSSVQQDANYLLSRISYDFGRAENIINPSLPGVSSPSAQLLIDTTTYDLYENSGILIASTGGILRNLSSTETTISNLNFLRVGEGNASDTIRITFDITSKSKKQSGYDVTHFSTTLGIREK